MQIDFYKHFAKKKKNKDKSLKFQGVTVVLLLKKKSFSKLPFSYGPDCGK